MKTYNIPLENMPQFAAKLDKLAKRAAKLGLVGPTIKEVGTHMQKLGRLWIEIVTVEMELGEEVKINDWQFLAKIEHLPTGNIVKSFIEKPLDAWYWADPNCEHCGLTRHRKTTYILFRVDEELQVGSTCLKDFTGHADAEALADYFAQIQEFDGDEFGYDSDKVYHSHNVKVATYLAYATMSVRQSGYVSRKKAEYGQFVATADDAITLLVNKVDHEYPDSADKALAQAVIAYVETLEASNDFEHNVKVLFESEYVHYNNVGYIAGAIAAYKYTEDAKRRGEGKEYIGTIKKREDFTLTMVSLRKFEGFYGMTYLYTFNDPDGNAVVWFASKDCDLVQDETYTVKGTVKDHKIYNNAPQTVLTRCKVK